MNDISKHTWNSDIPGLEIDLQLFAEGGAAGGGDAGGEAAVVSGSDDASNGQAQAEGDPTGEQNADDDEAEYQRFRTKYKQRLDDETQKTVRSRLRNVQPKANRADKMAPVWANLAMNLGLDPNDYEGIARAVAADESGLERRANKRGVTIELERAIEQTEREARAEKERADRMERANKYAGWKSQEAGVQRLYPGFSLEEEANNNPRFARMLEEGDSVLDAYESTHVAEIRSRAAQVGADQATQKVIGRVQGNARRAQEGATRVQKGPATFDPGQLTDDQLDALAARVKRGEKITEEMLRTGSF